MFEFFLVTLGVALLDDWIGPDQSDLSEFVAVDWKIAIDLINFEVFVITNRYNWVDIAADGRENGKYCRIFSKFKLHLISIMDLIIANYEYENLAC